MINYAQLGQVSRVAYALNKGADVDYADGLLIYTGAFFGNVKIVKLALKCKASLGLERALEVAKNEQIVKLLKHYIEFKLPFVGKN